jgi:tetratricopeptide (TPR) repeat protein
MMCSRNNFIKAIFLFVILFYMIIFWTAPVSAETYAIHIASYKKLSQAEIDLNRLHSQGYAAFVSEAEVPGSGKWYRVYSGKYETRQKAAQAGAEMKSKQQIDKIFIHLIPQVKSEPEMKIVRKAQSSKEGSSSSPIVVVGNKTSKRYHLPGMPFYNKVKKYHRILFQSEQEAIDQGYYKAGTGSDGNPLEATQKQTGKKEVLKTAADPKQSDHREIKGAGEKKEAFKALLMGNEKLMPPPPKLVNAEKSTEEVFKEPDEKNLIEPRSDSALYNKALGELQEKKYDQALVTFKEFISREDTNKEWGQRALRHMADCHYWIGKEGRKENLLIAAEFYKNTLANFPDPRRENALTYYRLAKTYEHLKYYPESIKQYQNLIAKYPDAPYAPEAYFNIGEIYYTDGKYPQAAEALIRYLMKYRVGVNAKKSFYLIAHSFYKAKQSTNAEVWFRDAQKKWPDFTSIPKELVFDYGFHKMSLRRFDEAAGAFSFYANMYPNDEKTKEMLMLLASAYRQMGQYPPALAVYDRIIEKYPDTKEANECILAMASLGVDKPGIKAFRFLNHVHYYRNPIDTYDTLIMKNATGDIAEEAMLQKAAALVKKGQGRKAADVYLDFLLLHPQSKKVAEAARGLKTASGALIDEYYAKKDYLAVAYVYFKSYGAVALQADEYPQINRIALSLKELDFMDDYLSILNRYLMVAENESIINKVSLDIAEGLIRLGKYDDAQRNLNALAAKSSVKKSTMMTGIRKNLAEIAYRKQLYDQAIVNYDAIVRSGQELSDPGLIYSNYARSLKEQKENTQALQNYLTAVRYLNEDKKEKVSAGIAYKEIGDLYLKNNNLAGGLDMYNKSLASTTNPELKQWSQFLVGGTYLRMNKGDQAQNTFAQMKVAAGPEGFWTKVVDFYVADSKWWERYGNTVKK